MTSFLGPNLIVIIIKIWFKYSKKKRVSMNKIKHLYNAFEKAVSGLKFAVIIITLFALASTAGTFVESINGTDYANRLVYHSWWFYLIQGGIFLSVFMATVVRLPPKKSLYGFYTIHAGLLILFIGAFLTYKVGIDGSLEIKPNNPSQKVILNKDVLKLTFTKQNMTYELPLPYSASAVDLNASKHGVTVKEFLPFAELKTQWIKQKNDGPNLHSSQYMIFNDNMSQPFTLSLNQNSDFEAISKMGRLNLHYMPKSLKECFIENNKSGFIIWNVMNNDCYTPEQKGMTVGETKAKTRFLVFKHKGEFLKFMPDITPMAINDNNTKNVNTPFRVFSLKLFKKDPTLFLFGSEIVFYQKRHSKWVKKDLNKKIAKLPWMGFKLRLLRHENDRYPVESPVYTKPIQDNGKLIKGDLKAARIEFMGNDYWVRSDKPLRLTNGKSKIFFLLGQKEIKLPYQITLNRFKMNTNPGTNTPASFESFVQLLDGRAGTKFEDFHIYMNNPLKYDDFTFYQASYFPLGMDNNNQQVYGSVLSVNYDPGRALKYFGCLLIVFGSIWHYIIRRKKRK